MNNREKYTVPNDPEFELLVREAFNVEKSSEVLNRIDSDVELKEAYEGILMIIEDKGFKTAEEYLAWTEEGKDAFNEYFNRLYLAEEKSFSRTKLITYSIAASIAGFIIAFGVIKVSLPDQPTDQFVSVEEHDSLRNQYIEAKEQNDVLLVDVSTKQKSKDSVQIALNSKEEELRILKETPTAFDQVAFAGITAKNMGAGNSMNNFVSPDTISQHAGIENVLDINMLSPVKFNTYSKRNNIQFRWKTKLTGEVKLMCYLSVSRDKHVIDKAIQLDSGGIEIEVNNLEPGVYVWYLYKDGLFTDNKYFMLLP